MGGWGLAVRIELCKTGLLMAKARGLPETLKTMGHEVSVQDCLDRCETCDMGGILGRIEGEWIAAGKEERFLLRVEEAVDLLSQD